MGKISLGINLEFAFFERGSLEWALDQAADIGYEYVEPMVHLGRQLLSEARKFHSLSMLDDPLWLAEAVERRGLKISALTSHAPLAKPEMAVEYLTQAIRYAAECGAPRIITDDGPMPAWTSDDENRTLMRYTLKEAAIAAERRSIEIAIENCGAFTATPERLDEVFRLVEMPNVTINLDTGNAYLSENDPVQWLRLAAPRMRHMHAKDIPVDEGRRLRGKVRGMLGCACGSGLIEWEPIFEVLRAADHDTTMSVECRSLEAAADSFRYLNTFLTT
jgi:sugar phosphate isomerase/epimerase